ncbi:MAG TPA: tol-pal system protein YbgF [bacterium]|nr:tol-pal system protein YbgF [bacterium]
MSGGRIARCLLAFIFLFALSIGLLSCASTSKMQTLSAKTDEANLLATENQQNQERLRNDLKLLEGKVEELSRQARVRDAETKQGLKELTQRLDEICASLDDVSQQQEAIRAAVLDLEDMISSLSKKDTDNNKNRSRKRIFAAARQDYNSGNYRSAMMGFRNYIAAYPNSSAADDAQYWVGESLSATQQYKEAIKEYEGLLQKYPKSDRTAETLLRLGMCYQRIGQQEKAAKFFTDVSKRFPDSNEARLAKAQLGKQKEAD